MASVTNWSPVAASNTSVGGISTDGNVTLVKQIDNMFRGLMAEVATSRDDGTIINVYPRGYLFGLTLSNNVADATNDIDVAAGEAVTSDSPYWRMALASAITKRLDAAWAVGTGNGGLDTGSIANVTYHVFLIQRSDTGVVDVLFSTNPVAPTMPANYDRKRRIGSIIRESAAIVAFQQFGDLFKRSLFTITASTSGFVSALFGTGAPVGIVTQPILRVTSSCAASFNVNTNAGDAVSGGAFVQVHANFGVSGGLVNVTPLPPVFSTNTAGQLYFSNTTAGGAVTSFSIASLGWVDTRGRV